MGIQIDSIELLTSLYNLKQQGKRLEIEEIFKATNWELNRFKNAYDYLKEKWLINEKDKTIGRLPSGLQRVIGLHLTHLGIDVIENDKKFENIFRNSHIQIIIQNGQANVVNQNTGQAVNNIASPKLENVSHNNTGDINYGNVIHNQHIMDNSTSYDIDERDVVLLEKLSISLIGRFGEKKLGLIAKIALIADLIAIVGVMKAFAPMFFSYLPTVPQSFGVPLIFIAALLMVFAVFLFSILNYKIESRCSSCKEFYSLEEIGEPKAREVKTHNGIRTTRTRTYKCKKCDNMETKKFSEFIENTEAN